MKRRRLLLAATWVFLAGPAGAWAQAPSPDPFTAEARNVLGVPSGRPRSGAELDASTEELAGLLRCPVCQGLSVADSPSSMALNMKAQVRDLLAAGYDEQQVLAYFERSYGEFVRLKPPLRGINWLLWLAPVVALAAGGLVLRQMVRRPAAPTATGPAPVAAVAAAPSAPSDPKLDPYLARVRALAYGEEPAAPAADAAGRRKDTR